jgi:hypothetical protein
MKRAVRSRRKRRTNTMMLGLEMTKKTKKTMITRSRIVQQPEVDGVLVSRKKRVRKKRVRKKRVRKKIRRMGNLMTVILLLLHPLRPLLLLLLLLKLIRRLDDTDDACGEGGNS